MSLIFPIVTKFTWMLSINHRIFHKHGQILKYYSEVIFIYKVHQYLKHKQATSLSLDIRVHAKLQLAKPWEIINKTNKQTSIKIQSFELNWYAYRNYRGKKSSAFETHFAGKLLVLLWNISYPPYTLPWVASCES